MYNLSKSKDKSVKRISNRGYIQWEGVHCPVCNKVFYPTGEHIYKRIDKNHKTIKYCSYSCARSDGWEGTYL